MNSKESGMEEEEEEGKECIINFNPLDLIALVSIPFSNSFFLRFSS